MSHLLFWDPIDQSVINRTDEVPVLTRTIPGGLFPANVLKIEQTGKWCNGAASGRSYTCRLKMNGQTLTTYTVTQGSSASFYAVIQRWLLVAVSSDAVRAVILYGTGGAGSDSGSHVTLASPGAGGSVAYGDVNMLKNDPAYIDFSKPVQLEITNQNSHAAATNEFRSMGVWGVLLGDGISRSTRPQPIGKVGA